jgi:aminoglycoside 6'-N-acetyltransferase
MAGDALVLRGERVTLRPTRPEDTTRLLEILREPGIRAWWGDYDADGLRRDLVEPEDGVAFAIEADGEVIGAVQYTEEEDPNYRHAGIDVFVATPWHGRGLGTEAVRVLSRYLVEGRGHHRLTIDPAAANAPAIRSYEKVGFRPVGVMRRYERGSDGEWRDGLLMDLLADELR